MKQKQQTIWRNIDFTNTSAYKTIEGWEKVTGIEYNPEDRTQRSSEGSGKGPDKFPCDEWKQLKRLMEFDAIVHPELSPIRKVITNISRQNIQRQDKEGRIYKQEVLTYFGDWIGVDWAGNDIRVNFMEGWYKKPKTKFVPSDSDNPQARDKFGNRLGTVQITSQTNEYGLEVPNDLKGRKDFIKKILDSSIGTFSENIKYYWKRVGPSNTGSMNRCGQYSYDQFVNSSLDDMERLANQKGGPRGDALWKDENNKIRDKYGHIVG